MVADNLVNTYRNDESDQADEIGKSSSKDPRAVSQQKNNRNCQECIEYELPRRSISLNYIFQLDNLETINSALSQKRAPHFTYHYYQAKNFCRYSPGFATLFISELRQEEMERR